MLALLITGVAWAGYGDPQSGIPSPLERQVHLWTNAVRVDPGAYQAEYPCPFSSFTAEEQAPKDPLLWSVGLGEAARAHTVDMASNAWFSHSSSDGTSFPSRLARYYDGGFIGENIAWGYAEPYSAVVKGWMCSSGHRANIEQPAFSEIGTGVLSDYYTQDFGAGSSEVVPEHPLSVGAHVPDEPTTSVTLYVIWSDPEQRAPQRLDAMVDGMPYAMELHVGPAGRGLYALELDVAPGCTFYWFQAQDADGLWFSYPQDGSYGLGDCSYDDQEARWALRGADASLDDWDDVESAGCGCSASPAPGRGGAVLYALALGLRRRRRS